jgi:hypothetical protein
LWLSGIAAVLLTSLAPDARAASENDLCTTINQIRADVIPVYDALNAEALASGQTTEKANLLGAELTAVSNSSFKKLSTFFAKTEGRIKDVKGTVVLFQMPPADNLGGLFVFVNLDCRVTLRFRFAVPVGPRYSSFVEFASELAKIGKGDTIVFSAKVLQDEKYKQLGLFEYSGIRLGFIEPTYDAQCLAMKKE